MVNAVTILLSIVGLSSVQLHVSGTRVVTPAGSTMRFHGIDICSLEWDAKGDHIEQSLPVAFDKWGANLIRVPLSEDRWFGKGPDSKGDGTNYRKIVDRLVSESTRRGKYILLDLHWSNCGVWGQNIAQHKLPDIGSLAFWKDCAKRYANKPAVLFDLYNEPIDAPWTVWRNGGPITEQFNGQTLSYQAIGMQTLVEAIRGVGAKNVIVAGGLGYASRMDGLITNRLVDKSGNGIVYSNHFYPGWESTDSWEKRMIVATKQLPVLVGEFGADPQSLPLDYPKRRAAQVLAVLKKHDWNWCAWCMHPAASPCLIADWTYKPTPYFGSLVMDALKGKSVPIPPRLTKIDNKTIYQDGLKLGYQSWGSAKVDFQSTTVKRGQRSIQVDANAGQQVQLGNVPFDGNPYAGISMYLNGGTAGGQRLVLFANVMDAGQKPVKLPELRAGVWTHVMVTFRDLGIAGKENVKSFVLRSADGSSLPTYYVDEIVLVGKH
ncbi:MAG: cellulase family glycosylhydrolase [Fimbriimonas sp.]|nr:cellulase family glycosylhydrolase [Fimbriimonas sp.]